ncbi:MAG: preprotein translocase subunit SecY [Parcubacteria group bacterium]|nr:preprotein translocase subunit SecY [Parcubacteria group bacterium]
MNKLRQIFQIKELRNSIFFVLAMLFLFRVLAHIPVPGVNVENLQAFFQSNQLLGLINIFSGGGLANFSIVALGVSPYITSSIIFQLMVMIVPRLEEIQKEGESGQQKINMWTRWASIPLAAIQSFAFLTLLDQQAQFDIVSSMSIVQTVITVTSLTAGTVLLMWIGELISERNIGNGLSMIIFAGIIADLPSSLQQAIVGFDQSQVMSLLAFGIIALVTIVAIVFITEGQRNIPVSYARQSRVTGSSVDSHLPLRVNMTGVIPIIFAISVALFPPTIAQFFFSAQNATIVSAAHWVYNAFQNQLIYGLLYFILVVAFTFFYSSVVFKPEQVAENLQKQGAFIPGIRPGKPTESYLTYIVNRVILTGALFLGIIAVLPIVMQEATGLQALAIGGTSLLIVVGVVIEIVQQVNAQLTMHNYETL